MEAEANKGRNGAVDIEGKFEGNNSSVIANFLAHSAISCYVTAFIN